MYQIIGLKDRVVDILCQNHGAQGTVMRKYMPGYTKLFQNGEFESRIRILKERLKSCIICPHHCSVDRSNNEKGFCRAGARMVINGYGPHFGEESILVGTCGSGTIFFSYCNLQCVFCQNYEISHNARGYEVNPSELAQIMMSFQRMGCHNINLVSPSHYVPQIAEAVFIAAKDGLVLPLVYNTGGYDDIDTLKLLDGIIDIYMPDIKFGDNNKAKKYTKSADYFDKSKLAVKEMHRQVGILKTDERDVAFRGLLVRHLVMPENIANTDKVFEFIANEVSKDTFVNTMSQYYPVHKSYTFSELSRKINKCEYDEAIENAKKFGLRNILKNYNG